MHDVVPAVDLEAEAGLGQRQQLGALGARLTINGVYDGPTTKALKTYQGRRGIAVTGNVTSGVWWHLFRGGR